MGARFFDSKHVCASFPPFDYISENIQGHLAVIQGHLYYKETMHTTSYGTNRNAQMVPYQKLVVNNEDTNRLYSDEAVAKLQCIKQKITEELARESQQNDLKPNPIMVCSLNIGEFS